MAIDVHPYEPVLPIPAPVPEHLTFEEFLDWTDEDTCAEWVDGKVVLLSPASRTHQNLVRFLINIMSGFVESENAGEVPPAPFVMKTGPGLPAREPDLIFVRADHLDRFREHYLDGPADLAVEIVSMSRLARDRTEKYGEYERGGVQEYWVIDLPRREARFNTLGEEGTFQPIVLEPDGILRSRVLDGLWLDPDWFWQSPLPKVKKILQKWNIE